MEQSKRRFILLDTFQLNGASQSELGLVKERRR